MVRPKKRFSQNFLVDDGIAADIVSQLEIDKGDTIFEIGSGRGILTGMIAETGAKLYSFEIDRSLVRGLIPKFAGYKNVEIVNMDFLLVEPYEGLKEGIKLIGNIPYDITSPVMDWIVTHHRFINRAVITAQKELADRISSQPESKDWAPIAIFARCFFEIKTAFTVPPEAFYPKPKVYSSTMVFEPQERYRIDNWDHFEKTVRQSFSHRRKLLTNNLSEIDGLEKDVLENILTEMGLKKTVRAEQLSIDHFIRVSRRIESLNLS